MPYPDDKNDPNQNPNLGKPKVYVVGYGALARELTQWLELNFVECKYDFRGYLWDAEGGRPHLSAVEDGGRIQNFQPQPDDNLIMGYFRPENKLKFAALLKERGGRFASFIHPTAITGVKTEVGEGSIIGPNAILGRGVLVEEFVFVGAAATIGIGATLCRGVTVDARVTLGPDATLEENVMMEVAATVDAQVVVGKGVIIEAGCVVGDDVPAGATILCAPAVTFQRKEP